MEFKISIPTELSEIKLSQYQKFLKVAKDNQEAEFINRKMVQIFCNVELKYASEIMYKEFLEITNSLGKMFDVSSHKFVQRFKMGGVEFGFIPNLEDISFGEYTDLDTYITDWEQMHKAMAVLYRPIKKEGLNGTYEIEKYNGSITYSDVMLHAPLNVVLGANVFLQFRERIIKQYDELFPEQQGSDDYSGASQFARRWGWYSSIYAISQGDLARFDTTTELPLTQCLTYLTFEKQKNKIESDLIKKK